MTELKIIWKKTHHASAERRRRQNHRYSYHRCSRVSISLLYSLLLGPNHSQVLFILQSIMPPKPLLIFLGGRVSGGVMIALLAEKAQIVPCEASHSFVGGLPHPLMHEDTRLLELWDTSTFIQIYVYPDVPKGVCAGMRYPKQFCRVVQSTSRSCIAVHCSIHIRKI